MSSFWKEFKQFVLRGNVVDLAVAVVVGGAFGKVVSSFVSDILMPPIGLLIDGIDFTGLEVKLHEKVVLRYGAFINSVVNFLIIAFCVFLAIKFLSKLHKKKEETPDTKVCPECCFKIPLAAKKCGQCGSQL